MYDILKTSVNGTHPLSFCDTLPSGPAPDPQDLWLFTDPVARELYSRQNRLDQLEHDVCSYAMYEGRWAPDELELKHEIQRLLRDHTLMPKGTFGHLSPHPTVYRAICGGTLEVAGYRHHFGTVVAGASDPDEESYLRFTVSGVTGAVQSARLRVYVTGNGTSNGPAVYLVSNTWMEMAVTWNTKPALVSGAADNKGALSTNTLIINLS